MRRFDLDYYINELRNLCEDKGEKALDTVSDISKNIKIKYDKFKLEKELEKDYEGLGKLVYELIKLDKPIEKEDLSKIINTIDFKREKLEEKEFVKNRNIFEKEEEKEDLIVCKNCGRLNKYYVANCLYCGEEL